MYGREEQRKQKEMGEKIRNKLESKYDEKIYKRKMAIRIQVEPLLYSGQ